MEETGSRPSRAREANVVDASPSTRTGLQLLARVKPLEASGDSRELFGNVLELGPAALRLEAERPLQPGARLLIEIVFPGQRHYARSRVPLHGIVRKVHDEPNLHYDVELAMLEKESHERLLLYLGWSGGAEGSGRAEKAAR